MIRRIILLAALWLPLLQAEPDNQTPQSGALALLNAAPTADQLRLPSPTFFNDLVVDAISNDHANDARAALVGLITRHFGTPEQLKAPRPPTGPTLALLNQAAEGANFLERHQKAIAQKATIRPEVLRWLLQTPQRLMLVNDTFSDDDNLPEAYRIIEQLYDLDPQGRDTFFNLILAMAVVWDQPATQLHGQYTPLPFEPDLANRYTNLRDLYVRNKAKFPYKKLTTASLIFVVDTPVPLDELAWAQKNCRWSIGSWDKAYTDIEYDQGRAGAVGVVFLWKDGPYTLEAIQEKGGICVDQAYFATITARANGIPAMIFTGEGRRGGHAWFTYLKSEDKWVMDVGRYSQDNYAIGHTVNPQTRKPLSNHEVQFFCNRAFNLPAYNIADAWCNLAAILLATGNDKAALALASQATRTAKLIPGAWAMQQTILAKNENKEPLLALYHYKQSVFKDTPDILLEAAKEEATLLRSLKRDAEAQQVLAKLAKAVKKQGRSDLAVQVGMMDVNELIAQKQFVPARQRLEEVLTDCQEDGQLALPIISAYLELTDSSDQQKEALRYLEPYLLALDKQNARNPNSGIKAQEFIDLLLAACRNAGDEAKEKKILKKALKK